MANDELKRHIADFIRDYSIEITPHDTGKLDAIRAELADNTAVYVAHPPGVPIDDIVTLAGQVQKLGLKATPHVIARKLESRDQLERALARCQELGIHNALCVAGDITADKPAYNSSLEVLQTGLFKQYGFRDVGIAGHPEGSKAIGAGASSKRCAARPSSRRLRASTSISPRSSASIPNRSSTGKPTTSAKGINLPIHVGLPGPASLAPAREVRDALRRRCLHAYAYVPHECDGQSPEHASAGRDGHGARALQGRQSAVAVQKVHFFAFGGVVKTARWANAVISGRFVLNNQATGFRVEDVN